MYKYSHERIEISFFWDGTNPKEFKIKKNSHISILDNIKNWCASFQAHQDTTVVIILWLGKNTPASVKKEIELWKSQNKLHINIRHLDINQADTAYSKKMLTKGHWAAIGPRPNYGGESNKIRDYILTRKQEDKIPTIRVYSDPDNEPGKPEEFFADLKKVDITGEMLFFGRIINSKTLEIVGGDSVKVVSTYYIDEFRQKLKEVGCNSHAWFEGESYAETCKNRLLAGNLEYHNLGRVQGRRVYSSKILTSPCAITITNGPIAWYKFIRAFFKGSNLKEIDTWDEIIMNGTVSDEMKNYFSTELAIINSAATWCEKEILPKKKYHKIEELVDDTAERILYDIICLRKFNLAYHLLLTYHEDHDLMQKEKISIKKLVRLICDKLISIEIAQYNNDIDVKETNWLFDAFLRELCSIGVSHRGKSGSTRLSLMSETRHIFNILAYEKTIDKHTEQLCDKWKINCEKQNLMIFAPSTAEIIDDEGCFTIPQINPYLISRYKKSPQQEKLQIIQWLITIINDQFSNLLKSYNIYGTLCVFNFLRNAEKQMLFPHNRDSKKILTKAFEKWHLILYLRLPFIAHSLLVERSMIQMDYNLRASVNELTNELKYIRKKENLFRRLFDCKDAYKDFTDKLNVVVSKIVNVTKFDLDYDSLELWKKIIRKYKSIFSDAGTLFNKAVFSESSIDDLRKSLENLEKILEMKTISLSKHKKKYAGIHQQYKQIFDQIIKNIRFLLDHKTYFNIYNIDDNQNNTNLNPNRFFNPSNNKNWQLEYYENCCQSPIGNWLSKYFP